MVDIAVLALGLTRAVQLARGFTVGLFRRRAYWMGALLTLLLAGSVSNLFPSPSAPTDLTGVLVSLFGEISFVGALLVALIFVDQNLLVLKEIDFFHRDNLKWSAVRRPAYIVVAAATAVFIATTVLGLSFAGSSSELMDIGIAAYFPVLAVALGYAAAALVVAARRSPDTTMRRYAMFLGISLAFGVLASTVWLPLSLVTSTDIGNLVSELPNVLSAYFLYLAATTLSPLGRVSKEVSRGPGTETPASTLVGGPGKTLIAREPATRLDG